MLKKIKHFIKKLTLFDKLLAGLVIVGVVIFAYIFFRKSSYITVTLKVGQDSIFYSIYAPKTLTNTGTAPSLEEIFYKGMKEKDGIGRTTAEVLDTNSYYLQPDRVSIYLKAKLAVVYNRSNNQYLYKGAPVLIGSKISLNLDDVSVDALVTGIDGATNPTVRKTLNIAAELLYPNSTYLETSGVNAYVANGINVGDKAHDSQGNTIIEVLAKTVKPADKTTTTADGRVLVS